MGQPPTLLERVGDDAHAAVGRIEHLVRRLHTISQGVHDVVGGQRHGVRVDDERIGEGGDLEHLVGQQPTGDEEPLGRVIGLGVLDQLHEVGDGSGIELVGVVDDQRPGWSGRGDHAAQSGDRVAGGATQQPGLAVAGWCLDQHHTGGFGPCQPTQQRCARETHGVEQV